MITIQRSVTICLLSLGLLLVTAFAKAAKSDPHYIAAPITWKNGGNATEAALGLKYAQELVQTHPKEPAMYALLVLQPGSRTG